MVDGDGVAFWKRNAHTKTHMKCDVHRQSSSGASHTLIRHTHTHVHRLSVSMCALKQGTLIRN